MTKAQCLVYYSHLVLFCNYFILCLYIQSFFSKEISGVCILSNTKRSLMNSQQFTLLIVPCMKFVPTFVMFLIWIVHNHTASTPQVETLIGVAQRALTSGQPADRVLKDCLTLFSNFI